MIYTIEEIQSVIKPVCEAYKIHEVYLFGSYARGEADEQSDLDFVVDTVDSNIVSLLDKMAFKSQLENLLDKEIDVILKSSLDNPSNRKRNPFFLKNIQEDMKVIYGAERQVFVN
ncbi:nucleotidyltransferase domain protein [Enterococcus faecalis 06-MB-DW-09]|nr:nucleotidyltransferase domain protein [Enterococcus faecalis 06-MB-DW-09]